MNYSIAQIWVLIIAMAIGTFVIRFSFLGLIGNRQLPPWVQRHLRYTPVAVFPALVGPLVVWPDATGGQPDLARLLAAAATLAVGYWSRNALYAIIAGMATLFAGLALF